MTFYIIAAKSPEIGETVIPTNSKQMKFHVVYKFFLKEKTKNVGIVMHIWKLINYKHT